MCTISHNRAQNTSRAISIISVLHHNGRRNMFRSLTPALAAVACFIPQLIAEPPDRQVAEWTIRHGGSVTVEGRLDPIGKLQDLPAGDPRVRGINLVGTLLDPTELKRFSVLTSLRELELPGPPCYPGAGS